MKYAFFIGFLLVWICSLVYSFWRGGQLFSVFSKGRLIFNIVMSVGILAFVLAMMLQDVMPVGLSRVVEFVGHSYFLFAAYLFLGFILVDIFRVINHYFQITNDITRFSNRMSFEIIALIILAMFVGYMNFNNPSVEKLEIEVNKPAKNSKELNIVAVSDIHLNALIGKERLQEFVHMINTQKPDIVLLGGDLIDRAMKPVHDQNLYEDLRQIKAPMGVFAVYGNHEYISRDLKKVAEFYNASNIRVLRDEAVLIDSSFYLIGRDDKTNKNRKSLGELSKDLNKEYAIICIDHQPWELEEVQRNGIDFQFSGHTHNGQFFPVNLIVGAMYEKAYGLIQKGDAKIYVSSGLGLWGAPYRIGTNSEIVSVKMHWKK